MKDLVRQKISINIDIMDLLNEQIAMEADASASYLAMASWCDQHALTHSAEFFYDQSAEEREHMMKIFRFVNDNGGAALSPQIGKVAHNYSSLQEVFELALDQEIKVTKSINNIIQQCRKKADFGTENFLQWFVQEQLEEEQKMRRVLDLIELMGTDGIALRLIDERVKEA